MRNLKIKGILLMGFMVLSSCSTVKVLSAWKAEQNVLDQFKEKNILVIARTANNYARVAFEEEISNQLRARGMKVTESFNKVPKLNPDREMTDKRLKMIKTILEAEGFDGIVVSTIKQQETTTYRSTSGIYIGASYGNYYPGYYGGFYDYYSYPFVSGTYYDSFGGYIPTSTSVRTSTDYVLETVAYNLDKPYKDQIVAVVATELNDPKEAYKTAGEFVEKVFASLDKSN